MINDRKIYKSIFLTSIFFVSLVFTTAKFLGSDFWYRLTNVRMDYLALFEDFVFYTVTVTVQPGDFLTLFIFKRHAYRASLFACLPTHGTSFIHLHIEPAPCRQAKNRRYLRFLRHHARNRQMI